MRLLEQTVSGLLVMAAVGVVACGGDDENTTKANVYCCALKRLATECSTSYDRMSQGLQDSVRRWREVGNTGNGEACQALIESADNGCSGPSLDYDESDAISYCAKQ